MRRKQQHIALWIPRLIAAGILLPVGYLKLVGNPTDVLLFGALGMEPHGRVIIGILELSAGSLLLSPQAATGALLAIGIMCGAIIAHCTVIGFEAKHVSLLVVVAISATIVFVVRRHEIPIIGHTLESKDGP